METNKTNKSLLEQAKAVEVKFHGKKHNVTREEVELAVAFLNGDITATQMSTVQKASTANAYYAAGSIIRRAKASGLIKTVGVTYG